MLANAQQAGLFQPRDSSGIKSAQQMQVTLQTSKSLSQICAGLDSLSREKNQDLLGIVGDMEGYTGLDSLLLLPSRFPVRIEDFCQGPKLVMNEMETAARQSSRLFLKSCAFLSLRARFGHWEGCRTPLQQENKYATSYQPTMESLQTGSYTP